MKKSFIDKMIVSIGAACFCLGLAFTAPAATVQAQAAGGTGATIQAHIIDYVYKIENGALYKRLYNHSTREYIGDWIFIRYLTEEDYKDLGWL